MNRIKENGAFFNFKNSGTAQAVRLETF